MLCCYLSWILFVVAKVSELTLENIERKYLQRNKKKKEKKKKVNVVERKM